MQILICKQFDCNLHVPKKNRNLSLHWRTDERRPLQTALMTVDGWRVAPNVI